LNSPVAAKDFLHHAVRHPYALLPGTPAGIINSARDWVNRRAADRPADLRRGPAAAFWEMDAPQLRSLPLPRTLEAAPPFHGPRIVPVSGSALFFLRNCRIVGRDGVVISSDNRVFADFTYVDDEGAIGRHSVFRRRRFPAVRRLPGWYATLCYPSSFAYFHWIVESLPRLKMLQPFLGDLDGLFVPANLEPQLTESLIAMGVRQEQLVPLEMTSHVQPENLLIPSYCAGLNIPQWVPTFLRATVLADRPSPVRRKLYISRSDASKRRVLNEGEIASLLAKHGFETIALRDLDFRSQAELFDQADVVVGAHGAGLANVAFCRPGTKVIELLPSRHVAPHVYYSLTAAAGGEYWYLCGTPATASDGEQVHLDFTVDPLDLAALLNLMGPQHA
jgi:capsular polysaccharide biosynthesis protein